MWTAWNGCSRDSSASKQRLIRLIQCYTEETCRPKNLPRRPHDAGTCSSSRRTSKKQLNENTEMEATIEKLQAVILDEVSPLDPDNRIFVLQELEEFINGELEHERMMSAFNGE